MDKPRKHTTLLMTMIVKLIILLTWKV